VRSHRRYSAPCEAIVTEPPDLLVAFLALVRDAAREGAEQGHAAHAARTATAAMPSTRVTLDELARLESCSRATIRRLVAEGAPVTYLGQSPRFDVEAFRAFLESRGRKGTHAPVKASSGPIAGVRLLSRGTK
jgi:hypothetical protein